MSDHVPGPEPTREEIEALQKLGFEERDIVLRPIINWIAGFFIFSTVFAIFTYGYWKWENRHQSEEISAGVSPGRKPPPEPRLQTTITAKKDIAVMRREEDWVVGPEGFGWAEKDKGTVRIPVERAMRLAVERGLPNRTGESEALP